MGLCMGLPIALQSGESIQAYMVEPAVSGAGVRCRCVQGKCPLWHWCTQGTPPRLPAAPPGRYHSFNSLLQVQKELSHPLLSSLIRPEQRDEGHVFTTSLGRQKKVHSMQEWQGCQRLVVLPSGQETSSFTAVFKICRSLKTRVLEKTQKLLVLCPSLVCCPLYIHEKPWS